MKHQKILVIIMTLVLSIVNILQVSNDDRVVASAGEGNYGDSDSNGGINLSYIWDRVLDFSEVIYKAYDPEREIPKGRAFGSKGANYTIWNITIPRMTEMNLNDTHPEQIKHIEGRDWEYTTIINVTDFQLTVNNDDYPFPKNIPKTESFLITAGRNNVYPTYAGGIPTFNNSFDNVLIIPDNMTGASIFGGLFNNFSLKITDYPRLKNVTSFILGNLTYIPDDENVPYYDDSLERIFLLNESPNCQNQLDNITNASGVIIIDDLTLGMKSIDASACSYSVASISNTNGTDILNILNNYNYVLVDNVTGNLTLTYNFSDTGIWPNTDFIIIDRIPDHNELAEGVGFPTGLLTGDPPYNFNNYMGCWYTKTVGWWLINRFWDFLNKGQCKGIILYSSFEHHWMIHTELNWMNNDYSLKNELGKIETPRIQTFTLNSTVGSFLVNNKSCTTLSGYGNQELLKETTSAPAVDAYNVIGNITIDQSPDNAIAIYSNRIDGWWGQTPGDSGIGGAIILGIAKYFQDYGIKPKYNLTFLFTTGEEIGCRGAYHYNHSHPSDNIIYWFGLDQLGMDQADQELQVYYKNSTHENIINATKNQTRYKERTNYENKTFNLDGKGSEQFVFSGRPNCDTFMMVKGKLETWDNWHRSGMNYTEGDSLSHTDQNDVNVTAELAWNISKYFLVDPDCWFSNVTFEVFDSSNDGDTLNDSIRANFTMNTVLPLEYATLEVLYNVTSGSSSSVIVYTTVNYTVNSSGRTESIVFSIPDNSSQGNYSLILRLYNSTGCINNLASIGTNNYNDSINSSIYHLYHPFGYINEGELYQDINNLIAGSVFIVNENAYADNITAYINKLFMSPDPYKCMLYRLNDSKLIGNTSENWTNRDNEDPPLSAGWAVFSFSEPKPLLIKGTQYVITCWGGDTYSRLYYDNSSYPLGRYDNETYDGTPPDPASFTNESRVYSIYCSYTPEYNGPDITSIGCNPDPVGFGMNITINANVTDISGVDTVMVYIFKPENETGQSSGYTMANTEGDTYEYVYNDTWLNGQYNYSIWAIDDFGNSNTSSQYSFNVSAMATVTVCTIQDEYGNNTFVNVTDPPGDPLSVGYELIDDGKALRIWNNYDSYYFNTSSGIQLTNHYNEYWSHNVLMLGYYNNDQWNLIYRTDELSGFNKNISSDNETFVNATLWKDLTYQGYDFRLAIRYHLGVDDKELTIIPYIKNLGQAIPYTLGFAWELKDIQVDMTPQGDYIEINGTTYYLNQSLDETYQNMTMSCFYIREDISSDRSESLYLCWNDSLDYLVKVKSRDGQYNAPVTLGIKIGTLGAGQEKYTSLLWHDASEITYYFNSYNIGETWATNPSYMVDDSTSTYASTTANGDVELCNGNNCSGLNLGNITKVELRVYGYYTGTQRDIILRPVFSGTTDGLNYYYSTESSPAWSRWFDITTDPYKPLAWSWTDIKNLDCDAEAKSNIGFFTLYCSKVEIRVTYIPNSNPVVGNPYPADDSTGISIAPVLNITVSDSDGNSMNITWLSNSSGSWQVFGTNNSIGNGTYHQTMSNASVNGQWWYWKVNVTDGINYTESSVYKFYTGNQSKIKNTGSTNISGYLLMQVQFFDGYNWIVAADNCPNETTPRTILVGGQFGLDTVFNGKIHTAYLIGVFGTGLYRVYACFRDPDGNVLVCDDDSLMEATYEFTVNI
jgi:hypothetical protein